MFSLENYGLELCSVYLIGSTMPGRNEDSPFLAEPGVFIAGVYDLPSSGMAEVVLEKRFLGEGRPLEVFGCALGVANGGMGVPKEPTLTSGSNCGLLLKVGFLPVVPLSTAL